MIFKKTQAREFMRHFQPECRKLKALQLDTMYATQATTVFLHIYVSTMYCIANGIFVCLQVARKHFHSFTAKSMAQKRIFYWLYCACAINPSFN